MGGTTLIVASRLLMHARKESQQLLHQWHQRQRPHLRRHQCRHLNQHPRRPKHHHQHPLKRLRRNRRQRPLPRFARLTNFNLVLFNAEILKTTALPSVARAAKARGVQAQQIYLANQKWMRGKQPLERLRTTRFQNVAMRQHRQNQTCAFINAVGRRTLNQAAF